MTTPSDSDPGRTARRHSRLPALLIALGTWAMVVPYVANALDLRVDVAARVELVDHVVPGLLAVAASAGWLALLAAGRRGASDLAAVVAPALAFLAGFWVTATHVPLVVDAARGLAPWGPALLHASAGPPLAVLALVVVLLGPEDRPTGSTALP